MESLLFSELVDIVSDLESGKGSTQTIVCTPNKRDYNSNNFKSKVVYYEFKAPDKTVWPEWVNHVDAENEPFCTNDICEAVKDAIDSKLGLVIINRGKLVKKYRPGDLKIVTE